MDAQMVANALILFPAAVFGVVAWRAKAPLGIGPRDGGARELAAGLGFGAFWAAVVLAVFVVTGLSDVTGTQWDVLPLIGILVYFAILFVVEEMIFRGLLMTGLGVVAGQWVALVVTSLLVAAPYALSTGSGVVPVIGAVLTNLLNGAARWKTGRIWFGVGMRLTWNGVQVAAGFPVSGYLLATPVLVQEIDGPRLVTGGDYGPEGGVVGLAIRVLMIAAVVWLVTSRHGPWKRPTR